MTLDIATELVHCTSVPATPTDRRRSLLVIPLRGVQMPYLPPTMSPTETTEKPGLLEHPAEAFAYFRREGVARVVCEEKHMGSRAVVIVCRNEDAARRRFGIVEEGLGICYTRTGRRFFDDAKIEKQFLEKVRGAVDAAGFWQQFETDWICLDAELMPWSAKAQELLRQQYAAVGAAARRLLRKQSRLLRILHRRMAMPCLSSRNISNGSKP